jgi:predicted transposase YdaD
MSLQRPEISAYTQILAGLKFRKDLIRTLFREGMMRESVIYQEILEEGEQKGEQRGRLEGERTLVLRLLARKVGELSPHIREQLQTLSLEQLENLGEALLDFTSMSDLQNWLANLN